MNRRVLFLSIGLFVVFITHVASGQVLQRRVVADQETRFLEYDGVLTDAEGKRMSGEYQMTFRLFDSGTSMDALWEKTHRVSVEDGVFQVTLGKSSRFPIFVGDEDYIGISVGGEDLTPRQPIRIGSADDAVTFSGTPPVSSLGTGAVGPPIGTPITGGGGGGWTDDGTAVRLTTVTDSVAIGTASPTTVFEVVGSTTSLEGVARVRNEEGGVALRGVSTSSSSDPAYGSYVTGSNTGTGWAFGSSSHGLVQNDLGWAYGVIGLGENTGPGLAFGGLKRPRAVPLRPDRRGLHSACWRH